MMREDGEQLGRFKIRSLMRELELVSKQPGAHAYKREHQYPDGFMLFLGTLFAPTQDREVPGSGFTHKQGDRVRISSPLLGSLHNQITYSDEAQPWTIGLRALMGNLAARGLLSV